MNPFEGGVRTPGGLFLPSGVTQPRLPPPPNLGGERGPKCQMCSGMGLTFKPAIADGIGRLCTRPTRCVCGGSGIDVLSQHRTPFNYLPNLESRFDPPSLIERVAPELVMSRQFFMETLSWSTVDGSPIANTTTENIVFPNVTIPANYMQDGRTLHTVAWGKYSTTVTPTIRFRGRWGGVAGTTLWDTGAITGDSTITNGIWMVMVWMTVRSNGSSGTIFPFVFCTLGGDAAPTVASATGAPAVVLGSSAGITAPAIATVDFTADTALSFTVTWSAASASNTETGNNLYHCSLN